MSRKKEQLIQETEKMHTYTAYGLGIHSEFTLPELLPGEQTHDVVIRQAHIDLPPPSPDYRGSRRRVTPDDTILFWENVCALQIRSGNEIIVDPVLNLEARVLRLFILGAGLAVLLHQREYLILHASAVAIGDYAAAFLGWSGGGKSTMAAAMHDRGHRLVADDIVAVKTHDGEGPVVYGGFPQIKVWPEVTRILASVPDELPKLHPEMEKRGLRVPRSFIHGSIPLGCVYVLAESDHPTPEISPVPPQEALIELVRHSFVAQLLESTGSAARHFRQSSTLVNQIPVRRLIRQKSLRDLPALARLVEANAMEEFSHHGD